ncbi:hypothetical protein [Modicisalibacter luteus]|uniref:Uncharacterized protein n=1 Tax=Modicisalibacter luteus TaxID=453962 RepID=A0ABV7M2B2_9GAMM|nr:hypothetical protein [Halomonas lutea]
MVFNTAFDAWMRRYLAR